MTRKVYNVGGGRHSEAALSALLSQLLEGDVARGLNIEPTGSAGLSVRITAGTGQIRVSQFHSRVIQSDAAETTTAVPAPTSNPRRNLVVAYIDPAVTPTTSVVDNTNGLFKFAVIQGAEAATPQIPTNTAVTAALNTENWIPLGDFRTNVGATSVVLANITDQRRMMLVTSDKIDFATYPIINTTLPSGSDVRSTWRGNTPVQIGQSHEFTNTTGDAIRMRVGVQLMTSSSVANLAVRVVLQANGVNISHSTYSVSPAANMWTVDFIEGVVTIPAGSTVTFRLTGVASGTAVGTITNASGDAVNDWIPRLIGTVV